MAKQFDGQAKDEKVLYRENELIFSLCLNSLGNISIGLLGLIAFSYLFFMFDLGMILILVFMLFVLLGFLGYMYLFWNGTYIIVTNKRILKHVKDGLFSSHYKEMKLDALQEQVGKIGGFFGKIFDYGDVSFKGKDENNVIWFRGVRSPKEVTMYVSRLRDYLNENPQYDLEGIKVFKYRKERYKEKETASQ